QGAGMQRRARSGRSNAICGQMVCSLRDHYRDGGSLIGTACRPHGAAMEPHELLHQRESDAGPLDRARLPGLTAIEPLEEVGHVLLCDATSGIAYLEVSRVAMRVETNRHRAVKGEFESVRQQVEYDLLPHVRIDIDRLRQRRTLDPKGHACTLERGSELACEVEGGCRQVQRDIARLDPPGLEAGEFEQRIDELQKSVGGPAGHREQVPLVFTDCASSQCLIE